MRRIVRRQKPEHIVDRVFRIYDHKEEKFYHYRGDYTYMKKYAWTSDIRRARIFHRWSDAIKAMQYCPENFEVSTGRYSIFAYDLLYAEVVETVDVEGR